MAPGSTVVHDPTPRSSTIAATAWGMVLVGALVAMVGTFLPWVVSGSSRRSSYEVFSVIDRLGLAPDGGAGLVLRWWPLAPLLVTVGVVSWWWGRRRPRSAWPASIPGMLAATMTALAAWAVMAAPGGGNVTVSYGPVVTLAGGAVMGGGLMTGVLVRNRRDVAVNRCATDRVTRGPHAASLADRS